MRYYLYCWTLPPRKLMLCRPCFKVTSLWLVSTFPLQLLSRSKPPEQSLGQARGSNTKRFALDPNLWKLETIGDHGRALRLPLDVVSHEVPSWQICSTGERNVRLANVKIEIVLAFAIITDVRRSTCYLSVDIPSPSATCFPLSE